MFLYQDWALGLLVMKTGYRLLLGWPQAPDAPNPPPQALQLPPQGHPEDSFWKGLQRHVQRIKAEGIMRVDFRDALVLIIWPLLAMSGSLLVLPYVVCRGIAPLLGLQASSLHALLSYSWLAEGCILLAWVGAFKAAAALHSVSRSLRDQKYLLRRELANADEVAVGAIIGTL